CGHIIMTRLYSEQFCCDECHCLGPSGWLYYCIQDHELTTMDSKLRGRFVPPDSLAAFFADQMSLGKGGPDRRGRKNNFVFEIGVDNLASYSPAQIVTILDQRDKVCGGCIVREAITRDRHSPQLGGSADWAPKVGTECSFKVCQVCHRHGRDKTWASLDGVVNGHLSPDLVTGFSFLYSGGRPIHDPKVASNLGCRAVPTV
ncbi:hypothetical protein GQ53DRAFT_611165, partial [Thozetella sp. PMI_491]